MNKTQFAQFEGEFKSLPLFLQKKLEEAKARAEAKTDGNRIAEKLKRAEKARSEKLEKQQLRLLQHTFNFEESVERGRAARETRREMLAQMREHKQAQASDRASRILIEKIQKSQKEQQKVEMAKYVREHNSEPDHKMTNQAEEVRKAQQEAAERRQASLKEKQNKLVQKHYGILKRNSARPFREERERLQKQKTLQERLEQAQARKEAVLAERREKAKAAYTLLIKEIDAEAEASRKLHERLEQAAQRKQELMTQRKERAAYCSQVKPKTAQLDAATALKMKMAKAEARREAILQKKIAVAAKSARVKTESDFSNHNQSTAEASEMSPAELKAALEASLAANAEMARNIAKLEAEKKALAAKLEDTEAKLQAIHDEEHAAFYRNPKKAYAWVVGASNFKTVPAFLETKTASSSVPSVSRTANSKDADNHWEML